MKAAVLEELDRIVVKLYPVVQFAIIIDKV